MGQCVPVVGEHKQLLVLLICLDLQLEHILLGLHSYVLQVANSVSDRDVGRAFIYASDSVSSCQYLFGEPVYIADQQILGNSLSIHQQNCRHNRCRHHHYLFSESVH